ncbi:CVNH domain-containing protein [Hirsutella rhossiliensis]|uniref:CVNH domain-containing protein n=1 Tax=Hirsutella rhossiliensis TaxID=111463 RepID=A0A9P8N268_9HYPO|nr:CVNH domain-containing protein [Hirsutella rhossiliensis]KAH0965567.1 CVNH domain-containing protein [Hirsutella rhossiliensis]
MHPARLILSTAAVAVPGPAARVGLPKKDVAAAAAVADGLVVGRPAGVFVVPTTAAEASSAVATETAAAATVAPGEEVHNAVEDGDDGPLLFSGQCRPSLMLKAHGGKGRTMLEGQCVDGDGQWWRTSLNLNRCIGAHDGELIYQESGDFDSLCWPCVVLGGDDALPGDEAAALRLECTCLDHLGSPKTATLQLGSQAEHPHAVQPSDGRLVCGAHEGDRTPLL